MLLFDSDAVYLNYWGTSKERKFIRSFIEKNNNHGNAIGITTYTKGEIYRIMLDSLVCAYNIFLKKFNESVDPDLDEFFEISNDIGKSLLPGRRERRKTRVREIIQEIILKYFKREFEDLKQQKMYRNPLKTILIQLYNEITDFDKIFLDQSIFAKRQSKIGCLWESYKISEIPLDFTTPFPLVGWGCSNFNCKENGIIQKWVILEKERVSKFINDCENSTISMNCSWIDALISFWKKLRKNPPDLRNVSTQCKNIGDFFLILDANKDDQIISSNAVDFEEPCKYFGIGYIKIQRDVIHW